MSFTRRSAPRAVAFGSAIARALRISMAPACAAGPSPGERRCVSPRPSTPTCTCVRLPLSCTGGLSSELRGKAEGTLAPARQAHPAHPLVLRWRARHGPWLRALPVPCTCADMRCTRCSRLAGRLPEEVLNCLRAGPTPHTHSRASSRGRPAAGCGVARSDGRCTPVGPHAGRRHGQRGSGSRARVPGPKGQRWWWSDGYRAMTTKHVCQGIHYLKRLPPAPANANAYPMILFLHVRPASERHRRELQCDSR